eukprot:1161439-Pelagomonas_calceolata.AAC.12
MLATGSMYRGTGCHTDCWRLLSLHACRIPAASHDGHHGQLGGAASRVGAPLTTELALLSPQVARAGVKCACTIDMPTNQQLSELLLVLPVWLRMHAGMMSVTSCLSLHGKALQLPLGAEGLHYDSRDCHT